MQRLWIESEQDFKLQDYISKTLQIDPLIAQILINRGIKTIEGIKDFLTASLNELHNPFLLPDMKEAVERIGLATKSGEKILIYGDYDVDGVTATSLLYLFFKEIGYEASYYIPNRLRDGYGLREDAICRIKEQGINLLITADCGTTSHSAVKKAKDLGIDVIITDHHEPPQVLPEAYAMINPNRIDSAYPFNGLAGVGVALKLAQGIYCCLNSSDSLRGLSCPLEPMLYKYLDLVALGTVADISSLTGENRKLVKEGLKLLSKADRKGIAALKLVSNLDGSDVSVGTIGFTLAPRINAAGRLDEANVGVMLLTTASEEEAIKCAKILDGKNRERQMIEDKMLNEAIEMIDSKIDLKHTNAIVLSSDKWHQGVIGIIASKIVDRYYRPTILISVNEDGIGKGSARSIPGFHLYQGLYECQSYLEAFGGHKYAAGLSIRKENIDSFSDKINEVAASSLKKEDFIPKLYIDGGLNVKELNFNLLKEIERLEPFGVGNPEPVFAITDAEVLYPKIVGSNHLKFKLRQGNAGADAIGFNMGGFIDRLNDEKVDAAVTPKLNEWQGTLTVQMKIKDIKFPGN